MNHIDRFPDSAGMSDGVGMMRIGGMAIRYSQFVPKLYNYCLSLGFDRSRGLSFHL